MLEDQHARLPNRRETPLSSIVIPCYDAPEQFVRECLESVIAQTDGSWEAIVVDDGSTRLDVDAVIERAGDPRIFAVHHPQNRGEAASRNSGIRVARGELIVALDADDRLAPDFLRATRAVLDASPEVEWVLTDRQLFGKGVDILRYPDPLPLPCPVHFNAQTPGMIRRSLWEAIGGYSEEEVFQSGGADLDFWMSAVERGVVAGHVTDPVYLWRIHEGSLSQTSFRYNNHLIHRALYQRHRALFRSFAKRCPRCRGRRSPRHYVGSGYEVAADTSLRRGERGRAIYLAVRGLTFDPGRGNLRLLARTLIPSSAAQASRMFLDRLSRSRRTDQQGR